MPSIVLDPRDTELQIGKVPPVLKLNILIGENKQ